MSARMHSTVTGILVHKVFGVVLLAMDMEQWVQRCSLCADKQLLEHEERTSDIRNVMIQREAEVKNRVTAVALTDSVHNVWHQEVGKTIREWMRENCCNWVSSSEPLDTSVESMLPDCPRVSAGKVDHGMEKSQKRRSKVFIQANSRISGTLSREGAADGLKESQAIVFQILSPLCDNKEKSQTSSGDGTKM
ncbi:hypothetical protein DUI87_04870 [Hirundo rustica rustica]|uniref:Arb2 domain-containing protein n=1 Tax=Hirundo rustica rustica TaxID=333673 RepID=A0A3M0L2L6_HIRRU|nr:hypothetical protein DUI87_04870 [Hirundo rustica rustica]